MISKGERDTETLIKAMQMHIKGKKHTRIDYIGIVHPETLESLEKITDRALIALAVFAGKTRLIDNTVINI